MTPDFDPGFLPKGHNDIHDRIAEILHLLHKLNRKVQRLIDSQDFSIEDVAVLEGTKNVKDATQNVKDATQRVP